MYVRYLVRNIDAPCPVPGMLVRRTYNHDPSVRSAVVPVSAILQQNTGIVAATGTILPTATNLVESAK